MSTFQRMSAGLAVTSVMMIAGSVQAKSSQSAFESYLLDLSDTGARASMPQLGQSDLGFSMGQSVTIPGASSIAAGAESSSLQILFLLPRDNSQGQGGVSSSIHAQAGSTFGSSHNMGMDQVQSKNDPLTIIPLPSAALAGMGMLVGIAGVNYLRKRK